MNYVLAFENQKLPYMQIKNHPSRDGYMITQIKRSFSLFLQLFHFWQFASEFIVQSKYFLGNTK